MMYVLSALNASSSQLDLTAAAQPDVARDREVERVIGAADQDVAARFEADAVEGRSRDGRDVELAVLVARAARSRVADVDDAGVVVRRARQVHGAAVAVVAEAGIVPVAGPCVNSPDNCQSLMIARPRASQASRGDLREIPHEVCLDQVPLEVQLLQQFFVCA